MKDTAEDQADDIYLDYALFIFIWMGSNIRNLCDLKDKIAVILYSSSCQQSQRKDQNQPCVNLFLNTL